MRIGLPRIVRARRMARAGGLVAALILAAAPIAAAPDETEGSSGAAPAGASEPFPRPTMDDILEAIAYALPRSLDEERFARPEERERILAALRKLAASAEQLERHGGPRGAGFQHLGASLAADAREVERRYAEGRAGEAGFLLQRLTENCVDCHSRLPSKRDSGLGDRLVERMEREGLSLPERARLATATRQFDEALDTYEELFRSSEMTPAQLDLMGYLADYLTVSVRVTGETKRALATLRRLAGRDDVPDWLARDLATWIPALEKLGPEAPAGSRAGSIPDARAVERARELLAEGERLREVPADHTGLVHDLVASSLLYRYTESHPEGGRDVAEAYYLLGLAESRIDRSYWLSNADFYLETSIRMAPREPFAVDAFELLLERTLAGYTGSSGTHVPPDVQRRLDALRALVTNAEQAPAPAAP